jgi:hypothetical protein
MDSSKIIELLLQHGRQELGIPIVLPCFAEHISRFAHWALTGSPVEGRQLWFCVGNAKDIESSLQKEQRGRIFAIPPSKLDAMFRRGPYDALVLPIHGFAYADPNLLLSSFWANRGAYELCKEYQADDHTLWIWKAKGKPLKLFALDHHHAVLWDVKKILRPLGVQVDFVWLCDGRPSVNEALPCQIPSFLNSLDIYKPDPECALSEETKKFILEENYDGVLTAHSLVTCFRLRDLGLPMVHVNSTRFGNEWIQTPSRHEALVRAVQNLLQTNRLHLVHNNHGDKQYFHQFLPHIAAHQEIVIPSLCEHKQRLRLSPPAKCKLLLWDPRQTVLRPNGSPFCKTLYTKCKQAWGDAFESQAILMAQEKSYLPEGYLDSYTAVIHIPYNISTMSMFEQARANIPIWVPSKRLLASLLADAKEPNELSWTAFAPGSETTASVMDKVRQPEVIEQWLHHADFYKPSVLPTALQFDSLEELLEKAMTTDYEGLMKKSEETQQDARENITFAWEQVLQSFRMEA